MSAVDQVTSSRSSGKPQGVRFGVFDDAAKEYIVERPDTPRPWSNYLGDTRYGAIITANGGGYSFLKSAAQGRFLRFRSNAVPGDLPGRTVYLRDERTGEFWSNTWLPVRRPLDKCSYRARHGTGYTVVESEVAGIATETTYFVPLGALYEIWRVKLTNRSAAKRTLRAFTYCEFASHWSLSQDTVNLQYSQNIVIGRWHGDLASIVSNPNLEPPGSSHAFIGLAGAKVTGYDLDREVFIGTNAGYHDPEAVVRGKCLDSQAFSDNACGGLETLIELEAGETKEFCVVLGVGFVDEGRSALNACSSAIGVQKMLDEVKQHWHAKLQALTVETPDPAFDSMANVWGAYNSLVTFNWSRAASLVYNGERDGLGYRDTVQDMLGAVAMIPEEVKERLTLMISGQLACGGAMPVVKPFDHHPGKEVGPPEEEFRSDDCQWLFNAVPAYVAETGDLGYYSLEVPYADHGSATVLGHLRRALEFNLERTGMHGLPAGLAADWNDCLKLGYRGESVFVTFQVRFGLGEYSRICRRLGKSAEADWADAERAKLDALIQKHCWDGQWFIWAIGEDGTVYGCRAQEEGTIYLNTQVWAVMSGAATAEQARSALDAVDQKLSTDYGLMLAAPPFAKMPIDVMRAVLFVPGIKENSGIFNHTQGWGVIAETMVGNGDRAYKYYESFLPASQNEYASIREVEPYVHAQSTHSLYSEKYGRSRLSWLTGAATWSHVAGTQHILGIRPEEDGLRIDPCIPSDWPGFKAVRFFRGAKYEIAVTNPNGKNRGVTRLIVNGKQVEGNLLPPAPTGSTLKVEVTLE